ncbi:Fur family transcriptional regulator [Clostridium neuense]|uniref:Fur family transcriptional regulator n=1 Tax=Clostridium neuense TaxID=1728934 RepID=A0ABW8TJ76_9CLOT
MDKSDYIEAAKIKLKARGYKLTYPRFEMLNIICDSKKHMDAYEIYDKVKEKNIGLSTVYRNILIFEKVGVLKKICVSKVGYYELEPLGKYKIHIHGKCVKCNKIMDLDYKYIKNYLNEFVSKLQGYDNISIEGVSIILSVLCEKCKA